MKRRDEARKQKYREKKKKEGSWSQKAGDQDAFALKLNKHRVGRRCFGG